MPSDGYGRGRRRHELPGSAPLDEPLEVRLDRPFVFILRDVATGAVLFLGHYAQPE